MAATQFYGTGRRKTSVARVWLRPGGGRILVNRRPFEDYFPRETLRMIIAQPLQLTNTFGTFDATINVPKSRTEEVCQSPTLYEPCRGGLRAELSSVPNRGGAQIDSPPMSFGNL
jgi:hypothetical protein